MMKPISVVTVLCGCLLFGGALAGCGSGGDGLVHSHDCTESFTACGGDPTGTWEIVDVCNDGNIADEYNEVGLPACQGDLESVSLAAAGTVTYDAESVTYKGKVQQTRSERYSLDCAEATHGITSLNTDTCHQIERESTDTSNGLVTTCDFAGTCRCVRTSTADMVGTNSYVIKDATITEGDGSSYEFCVKGSSMLLRENAYRDAYAVTTLRKR